MEITRPNSVYCVCRSYLDLNPVVITIHGGFWQSKYGLEENTPLDEDLTRRGYATWNIEYRRVGEDGGGWPGTFIDVIDAVNHLTQLEERFQLDLSRVVILGHSAGGHLALWLASRINKVQTDEIGNTLLIPIQTRNKFGRGFGFEEDVGDP